MEKSTKLLTQVTCEEQWTAVVGREKFSLNAKQVEVIKQATKEGNRGIIWFERFGISIPHIQSISLESRQYYEFEEGSGVKSLISKSEYEKKVKDLAIK